MRPLARRSGADPSGCHRGCLCSAYLTHAEHKQGQQISSGQVNWPQPVELSVRFRGAVADADGQLAATDAAAGGAADA